MSAPQGGALAGKVCLVTGASRGIGKGIALQLGQAGATVYITGRTLKSTSDTTGSLEETAKEVEKRGGRCIPLQCDHTQDDDIHKLFATIQREQDGRLDVLVNNAYSAVNHITKNIGKKFWEQETATWDIVNNVGLRNHYICSVLAARMMVPQRLGLIINVSSGGGLNYFFSVPYGVGKAACDRMMADCAIELRPHKVACISVWPGAVQTEKFKEIMHDENLPKGVSIGSNLTTESLVSVIQAGESPELTGKAVVALATDGNVMHKSGRTLLIADLADEYGFVDIDGNPPGSMRSPKWWLQSYGYPGIARFIPRWIKIPTWMLWLYGNRL